MLRRRLHAEWLLVAVLSCLFVGSASLQTWFSAIDYRIYDTASVLAAPTVDERIVLVEIDEASLQQFGRWPWSRDVHARAIETLGRYAPAAVAYNVLFLESSANDVELGNALLQARPIFLPGIAGDGEGQVVKPAEPLASGANKVGVALLLGDSDGVVRQAERSLLIGGRQVDQLPTLLAKEAKAVVPTALAANQRFLISYNRNQAFRRLSFANLAKGEIPSELIAGKLVLVGATAAGMGDFHSVPAAAGSRMSGVEVQANVLNTLLGNTAIRTPDRITMAAIAILPIVVLLVAFLRLSPGRNLLVVTALVAGSILLAAALLPAARVWLPPSATVIGLILVHGLWGWRRLATVNHFLRVQAQALQRERGVLTSSADNRLFGDVIEAEALRLETIIGQVRQLGSFIERVIERFPDAVFVVDAEGRVVLCNQAATDLAGSAATGLAINEIVEVVSPEAAVVGRPMRSYAGRSILMSETLIDEKHRIVSFTDITELQRSADERDDLLQFLSHDLRAPNAAIVWLLEAEEMELGIEKPASLPPLLRDQIRSHARHGLRLADDFVQLVRARRRSLVREPVDVCDVAREAADMVAAFARTRGAQLINKSDNGELWVFGDQGMLLRAAINLLENAVKFAPENAEITYAVKQQDGEIICTVIGPGPAMPAGRKQDPFSLYAEGRSADSQSSIGMGLSFVQITAARHDGKAIYIYHEGYGAEFQIKLPMAPLDD